MTACAAYNIGGKTLHSLFKLVDGHKISMSDSLKNHIRELFINVDLLIIDEFGMAGTFKLR